MDTSSFQWADGLRFGIGLGLIALITACGDSNVTPSSTAQSIDPRSVITLGQCVVPIADSSAICGTLTVAENRDKKDSRLIGLPFVVLPSVSTKPSSDPIVFFTGGPGPSPLRVIESIRGEDLANYPLRKNRDVIVLTHRGTDLTKNGTLDCPEVLIDFENGQRYATVQEAINNASKCKNRLLAANSGIDFDQYTTKNIARDHEDLRILLGKQRTFSAWNVLGSSYGSLLAQQFVRDFPGSVRSVVYDGPLPIQNNTFYAPDILEAVTEIVDACKKLSSCNASYPNLLPAFAAVIEKLETDPVVIEGNAVTGHGVLNALRRNLPPSATPYGRVPLFMDKVIKGDLAGANEVFSFIGFPEIAITPDTAFFSISCTDAGSDTARISDTPVGAANWPLPVRQIASFYQNFPASELCKTWVSTVAASKTNKAALVSDVPSLITVGQFDIATPVVNADVLLKGLSRAQKLVFVGRGHGLAEADQCMLSVAASFFDSPDKKVDASCIDASNTLIFE
jgi:pimeloyl-ACP methyl ester carboxylesterase